jgi:hypothetical protein
MYGYVPGGPSTWTKSRSVSAGLQLAQWQSDQRGEGYGLCSPSPALPRRICTMAECTVTADADALTVPPHREE